MDRSKESTGETEGKKPNIIQVGKRPRVSGFLHLNRFGGRPGIRAGLGFWPHEWTISAGELAPDVDVFERGGAIVVRADLPGVKREDISVELVGHTLVISGRRIEERERTEQNFYVCERVAGEFSRSIELPEGAQPDKIEATQTNGVLEVVIPYHKPLESTPVKVSVK